MKFKKLLTIENAKTTKGENLGYLTGILYLAPANGAGVNVCPKASAGCVSLCLFSAGRGRFEEIKKARIEKTKLLFSNRAYFLSCLRNDIHALIRKAKRENLKPAVRLNGTSDLPFLPITLAREFPDVQFYDYTKMPFKIGDVRTRIPNYHLTFSRSENNWDDCLKILRNGGNVAVPFLEVPETFEGFEVIDGDLHDLRFLDGKKGVIIGLKYKKIPGKKEPKNGFIVS